jgi:glutathione S-transferase
MAIAYSSIRVELREVSLANKPSAMLSLSAKGTVPVLQLGERVIDESLDIINWALQQADPDCWLRAEFQVRQQQLIAENDTQFKFWLDRYKYWDRYPEQSQHDYRVQAQQFLQQLESLLNENEFIFCRQITLADIAIFPFIRQFAYVDKPWFDASPYPNLQRWLEYLLSYPLFVEVMHKLPPWQQGDPCVFFPSIE